MISICPAVVAEITEALTPRVRNRVDALLVDAIAIGQQVSFGTATVTLAAVEVIAETTQIVCDCLLAPNCAHRAVVALSLPLSDGEDTPTHTEATAPGSAPGRHPETAQSPKQPVRRTLSREQRDLAERVLEDLGQVLLSGSAHMDAARRGRLAADLHLMRVAHLVLADRALTSFVHTLDGPPAPRCASFAAASSNLHQLTTLPAEAEAEDLLGRVREDYHPITGLHLWPLFAEPILTDSGFAGVQVTFHDPAGRTWHLARLRPGDADDIGWHYAAGETWAGISASHRELSRHRLLVANGTARQDGRLGGGRQVRAAMQGAWSGWDQVIAGYTVVAGGIEDGDRRGLTVAGRHLELLPAARALGAGLATELFGGAVGTQVRCLTRGDTLLGMIPGEGIIDVPEHLGGIWWPGLDRVDRSWVGQLPDLEVTTDPVDAADWGASSPQVRVVTQRWCQRLLDAGPAVLGSPMLARDAAWLRAAGAPFGADLLLELREATQQGTRSFDGRWQPAARPLHRAWLRLSQY